jgi:hypothetical protein
MTKRRNESAADSEPEGAAAEAAKLATELSETDDLPELEEITEAGTAPVPPQSAGPPVPAQSAAPPQSAPAAGGWPGASRRVAGVINAAGSGVQAIAQAAARTVGRGSQVAPRRAAEAINSAGTGVQSITQATARTVGRGGRAAPRRAAEAINAAGSGVQATAQAAAGTAGRGGRVAQRGLSSAVTWLTGQVEEMGPRLRIRDAKTLRRQFPDRTDNEIAELLVDRAGRAAAAVGGATGAWAALPVLPAFPAEVLAETLAVIGIELKLVAELHEVMGVPAPGSGTDRARAYLAAWASRRGFFAIHGGVVLAAGSPLARMLRRRLAARIRRSTFSLAPLFTGALAGAVMNRNETRKLGQQILADLRRHNQEQGRIS